MNIMKNIYVIKNTYKPMNTISDLARAYIYVMEINQWSEEKSKKTNAATTKILQDVTQSDKSIHIHDIERKIFFE